MMDSPKISPMGSMAIAVTLGFFGVLVLLMFVRIEQSMRDPLLLMLGALIGSFNGVVSYYFGTTSTSAKKDDTIKVLSQTAAVATDTASQVAVNAAPTAPAPATRVGEMTVDATGASITIDKGPTS